MLAGHCYAGTALSAVRRRCYSSGRALLLGGRTIRQILAEQQVGDEARVQGWIRSVRVQKNRTFIDINDGTTTQGIQVVAEQSVPKLAAGCAVQVDGQLVDSPGDEQPLELRAQHINIVGECDAEVYPLQKKRHTFEFLRDWPHLRSRTRTLGAILRTRNEAIQGLHAYFQEHDFLQINTPILTAHDCEGGGEVFRVVGSGEFFGRPVYLTVSGQLHLEAMAMAASRVYTLSPAFRAEPSQTSRHLAEFWMLEAEMSFVTELDQLMDVCEACIASTTKRLRTRMPDELALFGRWIERDLMKRIALLAGDQERSYARISYTDAIEVLQRASVAFQYAPVWGAPLQSEHEQYLADEYCRGPVFVTHYPAAIKPFYMLADRTASMGTDKSTVACMDLLVPGVGELVGGSLRENKEAALRARMEAAGVDPAAHAWYLELRQFGGAPHGGFGLGLERYLRAVTGMTSLKDLIPMPRATGQCHA
ncbi:asparaginyl-tRNA synthetase [Syncephalis pseudoplumigaleata]|uniref:Asparagine--tRNA ligase, mitochondrial n=1 Tax=Syncephalis pseudoplumigaleata TaxID=1712513 RepID=A0A4P9YTR3_9FUNG|nr:asparaginyl-tRNA synthetase [Syncephalis pseudoplumigaleata]|eukprot:RKP23326.1 asparaginyl-tRNA synthetase [Syncephalis pseudoplumigaleata]